MGLAAGLLPGFEPRKSSTKCARLFDQSRYSYLKFHSRIARQMRGRKFTARRLKEKLLSLGVRGVIPRTAL